MPELIDRWCLWARVDEASKIFRTSKNFTLAFEKIKVFKLTIEA